MGHKHKGSLLSMSSQALLFVFLTNDNWLGEMESQCSSDLHFSKGWKNWSLFPVFTGHLYFIWLNALTSYCIAWLLSISLLYSVKGTVYKHLLPVWRAVYSWTVCSAVKMLFRFSSPRCQLLASFLGQLEFYYRACPCPTPLLHYFMYCVSFHKRMQTLHKKGFFVTLIKLLCLFSFF